MDAERSSPTKRIDIPSPEWDATSNTVRRAMRLTAEINKLTFDDAEKVRALFSELTRQPLDETFMLIPPLYTSGGIEIRVGRKVFINQCCTIYDMGGVTIGDLVMIGPNVNIITAGYPLQPSQRRAYLEAKADRHRKERLDRNRRHDPRRRHHRQKFGDWRRCGGHERRSCQQLRCGRAGKSHSIVGRRVASLPTRGG